MIMLFVAGLAMAGLGLYDLRQQGDFFLSSEEIVGTITDVHVSKGKSSALNVESSYVFLGATYRSQLDMPIFANALGISEGDRVLIQVKQDDPTEARLIRSSWDNYLFFCTGIFLILMGMLFAMFGVLSAEKFQKKNHD